MQPVLQLQSMDCERRVCDSDATAEFPLHMYGNPVPQPIRRICCTV